MRLLLFKIVAGIVLAPLAVLIHPQAFSVSNTAITAVQAPNGKNMIFYQDKTIGDIMLRTVSNAFTIAASKTTNIQKDCSSEMKVVTRSVWIAAYTSSPQTGRSLNIVTPEEPGARFQGGVSCDICVDTKKYKVQLGTTTLYVMGSNLATRKAGFRVGFVSAEYLGTITEADRLGLV
ncbi:hypothetical protein Moror_14487 [Moniliophthora roreri MCA 2997]|uniref:Uncharacterized protein n=1 Tax=Moniliophthora roreri (strain MCA 2997) TaxID=1381753 RepID=V2XRW6_MONRO|nr:hypothetical protein Moror_14487 [Moniliophthora roreri MCA 2997]